MLKLAAVYFLKQQISGIDDFRAKYDSSRFLISPHITIVSPISELTEDEFILHVERVLKDYSAFPIQLSGLMKTPDHCLFLLVNNGSKQIKSIHFKLYSGILHDYSPKDYPFIPHITLGCFEENGILNEKLYSKSYEEASLMNFNVYDIFDSISIIKGDGTNPATVIKCINLRTSE